MDQEQYDYDGFISYSHEDSTTARRVQRYMEHFNLPHGRPRLKIFRDDTDIRSGSLPSELEDALIRSRSLIVLCSPDSAGSEWVRREISSFQAHPHKRPIILVLVRGTIDGALPEALRGMDLRYSDLRRGWLLGWMRPRAQIEMVRAIASAANLELRTLIPWDRRRRRRNTFIASASGAAMLAAIGLFPFEYSREVGLPPNAQGLRTLEYCNILDGRLTLTIREVAAGRNRTLYIPDAKSAVASEEEPLNETDYIPSRRILHESALPLKWYRKVTSALDMQKFRQRARSESAQREQEINRHIWLGEPAPNQFIILRALEPIPNDPSDTHEAPPAGSVVVAIGSRDCDTRISVIEGLYPTEPPNGGLGRTAADYNAGLPVVAINGNIWIGMPTRKNGGIGGLWEYSNASNAWRKTGVTGSVNSLLPHPTSNKLLVAVAPGSWKGFGRQGVYEAGIRLIDTSLEKVADRDQWLKLDQPTTPSNSDVQFCGFSDDATLLVRIDGKILASGPFNLFRFWMDKARPSLVSK